MTSLLPILHLPFKLIQNRISREKLWGGFQYVLIHIDTLSKADITVLHSMVAQVTLNRDKWISAMMLDPETGLDSPGSKLRAVEGIDAASSFVQGTSPKG